MQYDQHPNQWTAQVLCPPFKMAEPTSTLTSATTTTSTSTSTSTLTLTSTMKRLFTAVHIPPTDHIINTLDHFRTELESDRINWVSPANMHLTLKFFGDTPMRDEPPIKKALMAAGKEAEPFTFRIKGCGIFGNPRMPRVIWLGIKDAGGLIRLYDTINKHLKPLGHKPDKKVFVPHLTIARVKHLTNNAGLWELLAEYAEKDFGEASVDHFTLYQSILKPSGPQYLSLSGIMLGG